MSYDRFVFGHNYSLISCNSINIYHTDTIHRSVLIKPSQTQSNKPVLVGVANVTYIIIITSVELKVFAKS